ncbi:short-chain-fatty-acid--CoA ligase [Acidovorax sp. SRB_14]|uniref:class I adenylate-forming enzyme family protein n=1 Tax=Acidovorax sp. SRB_14 TaxID=1962699 RepID=UPI001564F12A|nr:class I adenylate-forming enzyme family protein [Acidovorax sp. SRB_14]NMM80929.1 short-chain-fatty-acid--CoA ligase [Acidovorax sp. SRB_14]
MILVSQKSIDEYMSKGWWGTLTLGEHFLDMAAKNGAAFAVADPPNRTELFGGAPQNWSWGALCEQVGALCAVLHAQGVGKDDVIVVQLPNCVQLHAIYLACAVSGVVVSPVPMQYRAHELVHVATSTAAKGVITTQRLGKYQAAHEIALMKPLLPSVQWVWSYGDASGQPLPEGVQDLDILLLQAPAWDDDGMRAHMARIALTANDVFTICWTSGTEARSKGVPRSHNEWLLVGTSVIDAGQMQPGAQMVIPFPFVNMAGISTSLIVWLLTGGGLHHHHPFDLKVFIGQLQDNPTDYTVAAPAVLSMLLKTPELLDGVDLSRLKRIGSGGGPLAPWLVEQFAARFGIEVINYFGSNEGAALSSTPQDIPNQQHRANYFPRLGIDGFAWKAVHANKVTTRLVDVDSGEEIRAPGKVGELRFKGPMVFSGYFNSPELTVNAFDELGFYKTGDLFDIAGDRGQYYRFAGRSKDIVVRGGMNISCEEVESLLLSHPKVREVAVIGWPDDVLGEKVCAVVVPRDATQALELDELVAYLKNVGKVAAFKLPERIETIGELPRNPVGKVLKRVLRERMQAPSTATAATGCVAHRAKD